MTSVQRLLGTATVLASLATFTATALASETALTSNDERIARGFKIAPVPLKCRAARAYDRGFMP